MNYKVENLDETSPVVIAEMRLLNAVFLNPKNLIESGVEKEILVHETAKDMFDAMVELNNEGIPFTRNAIFQRASGKNINVTLTGVDNFIDINKDPNVVIKDVVSQLRQTKESLDAISIIDGLKKYINENPVRDEKIDEYIRNEIYRLEGSILSPNEKQRIMNMSEMTESYLEIFEERKNGKQYLFGDPLLDKAITYGPAPGCGGLIAAATGMGKSAFCLNLINNFINKGVPCMYYSLEMGKADTCDRLMSLRTNIPLTDIVNPKQEDFEITKEAIKKEKDILDLNNVFRFSECASISLSQIKQDIKKFQADIGKEYCIVVFDLLSMVKEFMITDSGGMNFAQGIEVAINILNALAKELGIHYIAVLQMNRKGEDGAQQIDDLEDIQKFKPVRNQIKNAGAFLERVRWAIGLFRPKYYAETYIEEKALWEEMPDYCHAYLLKQNQGKTGNCGKWLFEPDVMRMTPLEGSDEEESGEEGVDD